MNKLYQYLIGKFSQKWIPINDFIVVLASFLVETILKDRETYSQNKKDFFFSSFNDSIYAIYAKYLRSGIEQNLDLFASSETSRISNILTSYVSSLDIEIQKNICSSLAFVNLKKKGRQLQVEIDRSCIPTIDNEEQSIPETSLDDVWNQIIQRRRNHIILPFWKNKFSLVEYGKIRSAIQEYLENHERNELIERYPVLLGIYVSEWYKRECSGNDAEFNLLEGGGIAESLFENLKRSNVITEGREYLISYENVNRTWLQSLFVLGGLPINWYDTSRTDMVALWKYIHNGREINTHISQSNAFLRSFVESNGSLHQFVEEIKTGLRDKNFPFAEEDYNIEPFRTFLARIQSDIWGELDQDKFKYELLVYKQAGQVYFSLEILFLNLKEVESSNYLSYERLQGLIHNVKEYPYFILKINYDVDTFGTRHKDIYFINDYHGYFFSRSDKIEIDLDNLNHHPSIGIQLPDDEVIDLNGIIWENSRNPYHSFLENGIVQLYRKDQIWSDRSCSGDSVLLFDENQWRPQDNNLSVSSVVSSQRELKWLRINDTVEMINVSNNQPRVFSQRWDSIHLIPDKINYIDYTEGTKLSSQYEDDLPVLFIRPNQQNYIIKIEQNGGDGVVIEDNFVIEPDLSNITQSSIINLTISYTDAAGHVMRHSERYLVVPYASDSPIESNSVNHTLKFNFDLNERVQNGNVLHIEDSGERVVRFDLMLGDINFKLPVFLPYQDDKYIFNDEIIPSNVTKIPNFSKNKIKKRRRSSRRYETCCFEDKRWLQFPAPHFLIIENCKDFDRISIDRLYVHPYDFYEIRSDGDIIKLNMVESADGFKISSFGGGIVFQGMSDENQPLEYFLPSDTFDHISNKERMRISIQFHLPLRVFFPEKEDLFYSLGTHFDKRYKKFYNIMSSIYDESLFKANLGYLKKIADDIRNNYNNNLNIWHAIDDATKIRRRFIKFVNEFIK